MMRTSRSTILIIALAIVVGACIERAPTAPGDAREFAGGSETTIGAVPPPLPAVSPAALAPVYSVTPDWPAADATITGIIPRSSWRTIRSDSRILSRLRIAGLTPGHVYNVHFVFFNHPEHNMLGSAKYSPPVPCGAFGPTDRRDGAIPETEFSVVNYPGVLVGPSGAVVFQHKLGQEPPSEVLVGPGLTNPRGAQVFVNVVDKGPELPAGPDRLQYDTVRGGCTGPPFFGSYPCTFAGNAVLR